jgi:signal transduction histidine kinase/CheY-like chemotaxis protein
MSRSRTEIPAEVEPRARALFARRLRAFRRKVHRQVGLLMVLQWFAASALAWAWGAGWIPSVSGGVHPGLQAWTTVGGALCLLPGLCFVRWRPNGPETRYVVAASQLAFCILGIQLTGGRVETQFLVFISMALLAFYIDPWVLFLASAMYAGSLFGLLDAWGVPRYGPAPVGTHPVWERLAWIAFQATVVGLAGQRGRLELYLGARHSAALEHTKERVEELVEQRTSQLVEQQANLERTLAELEQNNKELELARRDAVRAGRAREQFLANMGHELRTPLNAILGFTTLARTDPRDDQQCEFLDEVLLAGRTLMHKLDNVLALVRLEGDVHEACPEPVGPSALAQRLEARYRRLLEAADCELEVSVDVESAHVPRGARDLEQALGYLLQNAAEHAPGAPVELRFGVDAAAPGRLLVEVRDHGPGLAPELLETVFEPFRQSDDSDTRLAQGIGVGLSLARRLLGTLDASVELHEAPGGGLCARVSVPLVPGDLPAQEAGPDVERPGGAPLHVLLVEDNPVNQRLVQAALKRDGIRVQVPGDGALALQAFSEGRFDLVLMDVQMPVMDGLEATRRIRAAERVERVPILALTARDTTADVRACLEVGMDGHLGKPCSPDRLVQAVRSRARIRRDEEPQAA